MSDRTRRAKTYRRTKVRQTKGRKEQKRRGVKKNKTARFIRKKEWYAWNRNRIVAWRRLTFLYAVDLISDKFIFDLKGRRKRKFSA